MGSLGADFHHGHACLSPRRAPPSWRGAKRQSKLEGLGARYDVDFAGPTACFSNNRNDDKADTIVFGRGHQVLEFLPNCLMRLVRRVPILRFGAGAIDHHELVGKHPVGIAPATAWPMHPNLGTFGDPEADVNPAAMA